VTSSQRSDVSKQTDSMTCRCRPRASCNNSGPFGRQHEYKQDRKINLINVTVRLVRAATVAVEKQQVLHILSVCL
jgi:hypothetical protein